MTRNYETVWVKACEELNEAFKKYKKQVKRHRFKEKVKKIFRIK